MQPYKRLNVSIPVATTGEQTRCSILGIPGPFGDMRFYWPVVPTLREFGNFKSMGFVNNECFDGYLVTAELAHVIGCELRSNDRLVIIAVSTSGLLVLDALHSLRLTDETKRRIRLLVIDAPTHIRDIEGANRHPREGAFLRPHRLDESVIELPRAGEEGHHRHFLNRVPANSGQFLDAVNAFIEETSRVPVAGYNRELAYLERPPMQRPWEVVHGIKGRYIACVDAAYRPVVHPQTYNKWSSWTKLLVYPGPLGPSAGWAARPSDWAQELRGLLENLLFW